MSGAKDFKPGFEPSDKHQKDDIVDSDHDDAVLEASFVDHVSYGPIGIRGLMSSGYALAAAILASLGGFSMGYDMGVISVINTMSQFHAVYPFAKTAFGMELMTALLLLGCFVGCVVMPYITDLISRKRALIAIVIVFNIGAILQTAAVDYAMLVVGRVVGGLGVGTLAMVAPLYISEISPPNVRGTLLVLESICITTGVVVAFWITYGTRHIDGEASFRLPFGLQMVSATILGLGIHFFPYSPRWLALVDRNDQCLLSLAKLRGLPSTDERVQAEFLGILTEVKFQKMVEQQRHPGAKGVKLELLLWLDLFARKNWRRTIVGVGVAFFQQFSGINAFIYYAPTLFGSLGLSSEMALIFSGIFNILQAVAVMAVFFFFDKIGRRWLSIVGSFGMTATYIVIAVLSGLFSYDWESHPASGWACVAMAFCFILIFGFTYSPLGWALPSEVYSTTTRSKGVALSSCFIWLCDFIVGISIPSMMENIKYRTYIFFAVMCFASGVWAVIFVPETSGKTLEEIDSLFGDVSGQEDQTLFRSAAFAAKRTVDETTQTLSHA